MKLAKFVFKKKCNNPKSQSNFASCIFLAAIHLYTNDELPAVHEKVTEK